MGTWTGLRSPLCPLRGEGDVYGDMDGVKEPTAPPAWGGGRLWGHGGTGDTGLGTPLRPLRGEGASMGTWDGVRDPTVPPAWGGGRLWGHGGTGLGTPLCPLRGGGDVYGVWGHQGSPGRRTSLGTWGQRDRPPQCPLHGAGGLLWGHGDKVRDSPTVPCTV